MGDLLYMTRLRWNGRCGLAKLHGQCVVLLVPPQLGLDFEVIWLDYVPEVHICDIQPRHGPRREMTPDEVHAADRLLHGLCGLAP